MTCNCAPSTNITCASVGSGNEFTLALPTCVVLPNGDTMPNPYFDSAMDISYWGYKFILGCSPTPSEIISDIYIPIYDRIFPQNIRVAERILSCGEFLRIPFDFQSPIGVTPPIGYQFLHIPTDGRFTTSSCVYYRLELAGNFPAANEPVYIQTPRNLFQFTNPLVPGAPFVPNIGITNESTVSIENNIATIDYDISVLNTGNTVLTNIQFSDMITFSASSITLGTISVSPENLNIDISSPGTIQISGTIEDLAPGESTIVRVSVPIVRFASPNTYVFNSLTQATSGEVITNINTQAEVEVVEFIVGEVPAEMNLNSRTFITGSIAALSPCNIVSEGAAQFVISITNPPNSPEAEIIVESVITIPDDIVIRFTGFDNCIVVYSDTLEPVILNTNVTGRTLLVSCLIDLPTNSTVNNILDFSLVTVALTNTITSEISNSINNLILDDPEDQVLLRVSPLPIVSTLNISENVFCNNSCS